MSEGAETARQLKVLLPHLTDECDDIAEGFDECERINAELEARFGPR